MQRVSHANDVLLRHVGVPKFSWKPSEAAWTFVGVFDSSGAIFTGRVVESAVRQQGRCEWSEKFSKRSIDSQNNGLPGARRAPSEMQSVRRRGEVSSGSICRSSSGPKVAGGDRVDRDELARMSSVPWLRGLGVAEAV